MNEKQFAELVQSVKEMQAIRTGRMKPSRVFEVPDPDARAIRSRFKLSQMEFAGLLGISVGTLRNWEQGLRRRKARPRPSPRRGTPPRRRWSWSIPRPTATGRPRRPQPRRALHGTTRTVFGKT